MSGLVHRCLCLHKDKEDVHALDYRHSGLDYVPSDVFTYERTLEDLAVDSNQIKELPRELFYCHGLRKLTVSDNELVSIPAAVASLVNIEHIDISKNGVVNLPDNIRSCKRLRVFDASVNPLGKLPEGFTQLLNLTELYLNDAFLDYLPGSLGRLNQLKILEVRENHLKTLPRSLTRLTQLERLDVGNNDLVELADLGELTNLLELWCDSNRIKSLPSTLGCLKQLMFLDVSKNRLENVPAEIDGCASLADLHLSTNLLQQLPDSIGCLSNLTTLKVDDNRLTSLPRTIGGLVSLSELNVGANDLEELPASIGLLRHLRTLYADENFLLSLPPELGSCNGITVLSLRSNNLTCVPDEIGRIPRLRVLNLSDNKLQCLPFSLTKLKDLQALWLAENQTKPLIRLQSERDPKTGQRSLTCYLLPQQPNDDHEELYSDGDSFHPSLWEEERLKRRQIQFDFGEETSEESKLRRIPTPYPKEMKNRVEHMRNLALKQLNLPVADAKSDKPTHSGPVVGRRNSPIKTQHTSNGERQLDDEATERTSLLAAGAEPEERNQKRPQERSHERLQERSHNRLQERPQDRLQERPQDVLQERLQDKFQERPQGRLQERAQERLQEKPHDRPQEKPHRSHADKQNKWPPDWNRNENQDAEQSIMPSESVRRLDTSALIQQRCSRINRDSTISSTHCAVPDSIAPLQYFYPRSATRGSHHNRGHRGYDSDTGGGDLRRRVVDGYRSDQDGYRSDQGSRSRRHRREAGYSSDLDAVVRECNFQPLKSSVRWSSDQQFVAAPRTRVVRPQPLQQVQQQQAQQQQRGAGDSMRCQYDNAPMSTRTMLRNDELYERSSQQADVRWQQCAERLVPQPSTCDTTNRRQHCPSISGTPQKNADAEHMRRRPSDSAAEAEVKPGSSDDERWRSQLYQASVKLQKSPGGERSPRKLNPGNPDCEAYQSHPTLARPSPQAPPFRPTPPYPPQHLLGSPSGSEQNWPSGRPMSLPVAPPSARRLRLDSPRQTSGPPPPLLPSGVGLTQYEQDVAVFKRSEPASQVSSTTDSGYGHGGPHGERVPPDSAGVSPLSLPSPQGFASHDEETADLLDGCHVTQSSPQVFHVTINKNPGLGFSITGGLGSAGNPYRTNDTGIFVTKVQTDGPAMSAVRCGDKILEVNGMDFSDMEHSRAVDILRNGPQRVNMLIERL